MRSPTISERVSFRWTPDPPSEPTNTLVLTSPSGYFVDVRLLKATESGHESLQWAFAGRAFHTTVGGQSKGSWTHLVDSKHPAGFEDQGIFEELPNGDSLEKGTMVDEQTGEIREYEEVWHDYLADPPRYRVVEGSGNQMNGYFVVMASHALGIVKDAENRLGVSKWREELGEWHLIFAYGDLQAQLPTIASPFELILPPPSSQTPLWRIIEGEAA